MDLYGLAIPTERYANVDQLKIKGSEPTKVGFVCIAAISNRPREYELFKHPLKFDNSHPQLIF